MRYLHAFASLAVVLAVLLACKKKETASSAPPTSTAVVDTATAADTASAAPSDTAVASAPVPTVTATPTATLSVHPTTTHVAPLHSGAAGAAGAAAFKNGDKVDVQWHGDWWKANVIGVNAGPTYRVHYEGWGNEWDENVPPARIRARTTSSRSQ